MKFIRCVRERETERERVPARKREIEKARKKVMEKESEARAEVDQVYMKEKKINQKIERERERRK